MVGSLRTKVRKSVKQFSKAVFKKPSDIQLQAFLSWAGDCSLVSSKNLKDKCCWIFFLFLSTALAFKFSKKKNEKSCLILSLKWVKSKIIRHIIIVFNVLHIRIVPLFISKSLTNIRQFFSFVFLEGC